MNIRDIKGQKVYADLIKHGEVYAEIQGTMTYFNFDQPVIHISDYTITDFQGNLEQGRFIVLNSGDWGRLRYK